MLINEGENIMIYGYARVSSKTQLKGNSLEEQEKEWRETKWKSW